MAVFLLNQCAFSKSPSDQQQQALSNGVGANICGQKFDTLLELIHHIEDNHISDYENSPQFAPGPTMNYTQMMNGGGWIPTSCVLRIFNKSHKPQTSSQHQHQHPQQQQHHHHHHQQQQHQQQQLQQTHQSPQTQVQAILPQQIKYETVIGMDTSQPITNMIPPMASTNSIQPQMNPMGISLYPPHNQYTQMMSPQPAPQMVQAQPSSLMASQVLLQSPAPQVLLQSPAPAPPQLTPQSQPQTPQPQTPQPSLQQMNPATHLTQTLQPAMVLTVAPQQAVATTPTPIPKPVKLYKCPECTKQYKTQHGLRTHQSTHHSNSSLTSEGKIVAIMSDVSVDAVSGSPPEMPLTENSHQYTQMLSASPQPAGRLNSPTTTVIATQPPHQQQQQQQQQQSQQPQQTQQQLAPPKPVKLYKCPDCPKNYKTTHGLKAHQNTHHSVSSSPLTSESSKVVTIMSDSGDTVTGSPAADTAQQLNNNNNNNGNSNNNSST